MPRLAARILRHAASIDTHLPQLLHECRDLRSATNELRWLAEHARNKIDGGDHIRFNGRLGHYVRRRSKGEPLQYILGNQPFGELEILCRKGVLIPRPETELYTTTLAGLLKGLQKDGLVNRQETLRVADLCTGSGCIALLLHSLLCSSHSRLESPQTLRILGLDVSPQALQLAHDNLQHNLDRGELSPSCRNDVSFEHADVLALGRIVRQEAADNPQIPRPACTARHFIEDTWDVIISNPPYISQSDYELGGTVTRSVREHEPKLALVPPPLGAADDPFVDRADQFYHALIHISQRVNARVLVMEIGDSQQASRIRRLASEIISPAALLETWRDDGSVDRHLPGHDTSDFVTDPTLAPERAVVIWTSPWADWRATAVEHQ